MTPTRVTMLLALGLLCYLEGAAGQDDQDDYPTKNINCPAIYAPVCGTNGQTYRNNCYLRARNRKSSGAIRVRHRGPCQDDDLHDS